MNKYQKLITLRMHKLGVLIYDARLVTRRSIEECASAIGVTPEIFKSFETGETAPSLPQLEALALFMDLPVEHFWENEALSENNSNDPLANAERLIAIRNRIIGTRVQMLRTERNMTIEELANKTSLSVEKLQAYEEGLAPIMLPELEVIAISLAERVEAFFDDRGAIGAWRARRAIVQKIMDLPEQHQQFVIQPVNRPYLELAMRLSGLSVEKLRGIAEGLLEITY